MCSIGVIWDMVCTGLSKWNVCMKPNELAEALRAL